MLEYDEKTLKKMITQTSFDVSRILGVVVRDASVYGQRVARQNLKMKVYGQPPSDNYTRTGRALAGTGRKRIGNLQQVVYSNTLEARRSPKKNKRGYTPKEPRYNYAPMLNKNRKIRRLNTGFWDDTGEAIKGHIPRLVTLHLKKATQLNYRTLENE